MGAQSNWVKLQDEYECFYMVADWHALTTDYTNPGPVRERGEYMIAEWVAMGLDPDRSTLFIQSDIMEHAELTLLFGMFTPLAYLERNPTYKEQIGELGEEKNLLTFGFLGYPVLQAADILVYKAEAVPVGIDQVPHVELTRELARKFNGYYGEVFPEPQALLSKSSKLLGLDNRKMSKSYGNAIFLTDSEEETLKKVSQMITDPARIRRNDPGHPDICNVFSFHKIWSTPERVKEIEKDCRNAALGCVDCKKECGKVLNEALADYRTKFQEIYSDKDKIRDIINTGGKQARAVAQETMAEVRKAIKLV